MFLIFIKFFLNIVLIKVRIFCTIALNVLSLSPTFKTENKRKITNDKINRGEQAGVLLPLKFWHAGAQGRTNGFWFPLSLAPVCSADVLSHTHAPLVWLLPRLLALASRHSRDAFAPNRRVGTRARGPTHEKFPNFFSPRVLPAKGLSPRGYQTATVRCVQCGLTSVCEVRQSFLRS